MEAVENGSVTVTLRNKPLWDRFNEIGTEMIITKTGRRMFPAVDLAIQGLADDSRCMVVMDIANVDCHKYKYYEWSREWRPNSGADQNYTPVGSYVHPSSPLTSGELSKGISFNKLKLTNRPRGVDAGQILLESMHKYVPRMHVVKEEDFHAKDWGRALVFSFKETEFIAVTAYMNKGITELKIANNPFARGFREIAMRTTIGNMQESVITHEAPFVLGLIPGHGNELIKRPSAQPGYVLQDAPGHDNTELINGPAHPASVLQQATGRDNTELINGLAHPASVLQEAPLVLRLPPDYDNRELNSRSALSAEPAPFVYSIHSNKGNPDDDSEIQIFHVNPASIIVTDLPPSMQTSVNSPVKSASLLSASTPNPLHNTTRHEVMNCAPPSMETSDNSPDESGRLLLPPMPNQVQNTTSHAVMHCAPGESRDIESSSPDTLQFPIIVSVESLASSQHSDEIWMTRNFKSKASGSSVRKTNYESIQQNEIAGEIPRATDSVYSHFAKETKFTSSESKRQQEPASKKNGDCSDGTQFIDLNSQRYSASSSFGLSEESQILADNEVNKEQYSKAQRFASNASGLRSLREIPPAVQQQPTKCQPDISQVPRCSHSEQQHSEQQRFTQHSFHENGKGCPEEVTKSDSLIATMTTNNDVNNNSLNCNQNVSNNKNCCIDQTRKVIKEESTKITTVTCPEQSSRSENISNLDSQSKSASSKYNIEEEGEFIDEEDETYSEFDSTEEQVLPEKSESCSDHDKKITSPQSSPHVDNLLGFVNGLFFPEIRLQDIRKNPENRGSRLTDKSGRVNPESRKVDQEVRQKGVDHGSKSLEKEAKIPSYTRASNGDAKASKTENVDVLETPSKSPQRELSPSMATSMTSTSAALSEDKQVTVEVLGPIAQPPINQIDTIASNLTLESVATLAKQPTVSLSSGSSLASPPNMEYIHELAQKMNHAKSDLQKELTTSSGNVDLNERSSDVRHTLKLRSNKVPSSFRRSNDSSSSYQRGNASSSSHRRSNESSSGHRSLTYQRSNDSSSSHGQSNESLSRRRSHESSSSHRQSNESSSSRRRYNASSSSHRQRNASPSSHRRSNESPSGHRQSNESLSSCRRSIESYAQESKIGHQESGNTTNQGPEVTFRVYGSPELDLDGRFTSNNGESSASGRLVDFSRCHSFNITEKENASLSSYPEGSMRTELKSKRWIPATRNGSMESMNDSTMGPETQEIEADVNIDSDRWEGREFDAGSGVLVAGKPTKLTDNLRAADSYQITKEPSVAEDQELEEGSFVEEISQGEKEEVENFADIAQKISYISKNRYMRAKKGLCLRSVETKQIEGHATWSHQLGNSKEAKRSAKELSKEKHDKSEAKKTVDTPQWINVNGETELPCVHYQQRQCNGNMTRGRLYGGKTGIQNRQISGETEDKFPTIVDSFSLQTQYNTFADDTWKKSVTCDVSPSGVRILKRCHGDSDVTSAIKVRKQEELHQHLNGNQAYNSGSIRREPPAYDPADQHSGYLNPPVLYDTQNDRHRTPPQPPEYYHGNDYESHDPKASTLPENLYYDNLKNTYKFSASHLETMYNFHSPAAERRKPHPMLHEVYSATRSTFSYYATSLISSTIPVTPTPRYSRYISKNL